MLTGLKQTRLQRKWQKGTVECRFIKSILFVYFKFSGETFGDMFDKAVDKTLNNKDFMSFAKEKKR